MNLLLFLRLLCSCEILIGLCQYLNFEGQLQRSSPHRALPLLRVQRCHNVLEFVHYLVHAAECAAGCAAEITG